MLYEKIFLLLIVVLIIFLTSCGEQNTYSKEEMQKAIAEAEYKAYKRGYDEAEYYAKGEIERFKSEYGDSAYEAGYEDGYSDGLAGEDAEIHYGGVIKKDRD